MPIVKKQLKVKVVPSVIWITMVIYIPYLVFYNTNINVILLEHLT
jgi:hypothetical protein